MFVRPLIEINTVEWEATIDLNIKGALWAIAAVLPVFMRQQRGHIISLSSIHGLKDFRQAAQCIRLLNLRSGRYPKVFEPNLQLRQYGRL
jgi:NAD(P)-dependent dehydrogenase (short-subunit alcohol dehydrogenase family)